MGGADVFAGWDVGGVHVKGVRVAARAAGPPDVRVIVRPFEIWRAPHELPAVLREVAGLLELPASTDMGVTMTAELSDAFATRREGVAFVFESLRAAFPEAGVEALDTSGRLVPLVDALTRPLDFAATNWVAAALYLAGLCGDCLMIDVGSTTTDIIPIGSGRIGCEERTDEQRLAGGQLVYSGVVRTNPDTIVDMVPLRGRFCRVAAESFCTMADAYVLLGSLSEGDYTCPTPDRGPRTPSGCAARLSRLVCTDSETSAPVEIEQIARYLAERQLQQLTEAVVQVLSGRTLAAPLPVVPVGIGSFLAVEVARRLGLDLVDSGGLWAGVDPKALPAAAVALLLADRKRAGGGR